MLRSSQVVLRRIILGGGSSSKSVVSNAAASLQTTGRSLSRIPLTLVAAAAAGTAVCYDIITNDSDGKIAHKISHQSLASTILPTLSTTTATHCAGSSPEKEAKLQRKKTVLNVAASLQRLDTTQQVSRLRELKDEMLTRWERDEDGWRELPARAWPEYQPNRQQLQGITQNVERLGCADKILGNGGEEIQRRETRRYNSHGRLVRKHSCSVSQCRKLLFDMATGLVFYNVDPEAGFALYESLAKKAHADAMVACGIVLVEGLGIPPREREGLAWLEKAMEVEAQGSPSMAAAQAAYELGTVYYTGIDGIVEEDPQKAFELFQRAAQHDHTAALYMVADCLVEGEGTDRNVHAAIPLFYKAAERGHRFSRQRIRELLVHGGYPL